MVLSVQRKVEHDEGSKGKEPVMEDKEKMVSY
jgi:hypothetical protein